MSDLEVLLQHQSAASLGGVEPPSPVEVEDGGEVVRVSVEEELRVLPRRELIAELQDGPHTSRSHQFAQPGEREESSVSTRRQVDCHANLVPGKPPSNSLSQRNLSPPTSRMTILFLLSEVAALLLGLGRWSWYEEFIFTDPRTRLRNKTTN